jgi:hypothetical protein
MSFFLELAYFFSRKIIRRDVGSGNFRGCIVMEYEFVSIVWLHSWIGMCITEFDIVGRVEVGTLWDTRKWELCGTRESGNFVGHEKVGTLWDMRKWELCGT